MIFYFSGTGNSKWVAEEIAKNLCDTATDIGRLLDGPTSLFLGEKAILGLVFPIYAWCAPEPMLRFLNSVTTKNTYTFAVCTCGDDAGLAMNRIRKKLPLHSAYSIVMPNNYIIGFDVDSPATERKKIQAAAEKIKQISLAVKARKKIFDVNKGSFAFFKTYFVSFFFQKFARSTKPFYVEDTCNACGQCAKLCPCGCIHIDNGKPVFSKQCYQCLSCINRCSQKAIQYGKSTKARGRYYFGHNSDRL